MHKAGPALHQFPAAERERVQATEIRYQVAMEDVRELMADHMAEFLSEERVARWGPPDTSRNTLVTIGAQLSVPGHYGQIPRVLGTSAEKLASAMASQWPLMQHVEYLAYCLGACAVRLDVVDDELGGARAMIEPVPPHHLWAEPFRSDPGRARVLRRLLVQQRRTGARAGDEVYVWEEWSLTEDGTEGSWRVVEALADGELGEDVTAEYGAPTPDGPASALSGDAYPWRYPGGKPYIPWEIHRSWDVGDLWNWMRGRGAARGALQAMLFTTAAGVAALNSTGKHVLVMDARPVHTRLETTATGAVVQTLDAEPGGITFCQRTENSVTPMVTEIGEVDTLGALSAFADNVASKQLSAIGLAPTDAARSGANPMSGLAIALTNAQKRDEQRRGAPLRQRADRAMLTKLASLLGLETADVGVLYYEIARTPEEQRAELDVDKAELETGQVSRIDLMMRRNPGLSREQALVEVVRVAREEAEVSRAVRQFEAGESVNSTTGDSP